MLEGVCISCRTAFKGSRACNDGSVGLQLSPHACGHVGKQMDPTPGGSVSWALGSQVACSFLHCCSFSSALRALLLFRTVLAGAL